MMQCHRDVLILDLKKRKNNQILHEKIFLTKFIKKGNYYEKHDANNINRTNI